MASLFKRKDGTYILLDPSVKPRRWIKLGRIPATQAKIVLRRYESDLTYLKLDLPMPPSDMTFKELVAEYVDSIQVTKQTSTVITEKNHLDHYVRKWPLKIHEITKELIQKALQEKAYKPQTVHYKVKILRNVFNYAVGQKYLPRNPVAEIKLPAIPELPPRFVDPDIIEKIFNHMKGDILKYFKILYYTGLRPGEALRLRDQEIDLKNKRLFVLKTKTKKYRVIPIHKNLVPYLNLGEGLKLTPRQVQRGLMRAKRVAKVKVAVTPYAFRHTFATQVLAKTSNLRAVQMLLGHSRSTMTERYAWVLNQQLKEAVETL